MAKVLVVEDDPDIRTLVETRVRRMGHLVVGVGSAEEAVAALAARSAPDLAVLDVLMPGMSGLELLSALRQDEAYAEMPAIFLSGRVQDADIEAGRALGATYLTKPLVLSALNTAVEQALQLAEPVGGTW